jgi:hypothetical protein
MADDWRIKATLRSAEAASGLAESLKHGEIEHDLDTGGTQRVAVSVDDNEVFLYAGSREQAEKAADVVKTVQPSATTELRRWHPVAEDWEDPDNPLPSDPAALSAEQHTLAEEQDAESGAQHFADFEVRVELLSHHDTVAFANRLRAEQIPVLRRWKYLLVGAGDEEAAKALAERLEAEAPLGSRVVVEGTYAAVAPNNPFAVFGGLA